ncbi:MAG: DUF6586 family protein [Halioglobus sp.]
MASPRPQANQKLYLARIVAASWRRELTAELIPATVLAQAFDGAARDHLRAAYGWFLLEIMQSETLPEIPPSSCADLPTLAEGKAVPGEIRELEQLERGGWLAEMLAAPAAVAQLKAPGSLAMSVSQVSGPDFIDQSIDNLQQIFDRMSDSLDEY